MEFSLGQLVKSKKNHPCGGNTWEILRVGADIRVKCTTCGHTVMLARSKFEKLFKIIPSEGRETL